MNMFTIKSIQSLVLLILLLVILTPSTTTGFSNTSSSNGLLIPVGDIEYHILEANSMVNPTRRKLAPFQLCLLCKCCAASGVGGNPNTSTCASMPCCFGIDCQLPNKPFGVCAFVPKTCNCTSCAI